MSFTLVALTGVVLQVPNTPLEGAVLQLCLQSPFGSHAGEISDGDNVIVSSPITTTTNAAGAFSATVPANDDLTTTPIGSTYLVTLTSPQGELLDRFGVSVPHASAPSVNLYSLPRIVPPPVTFL